MTYKSFNLVPVQWNGQFCAVLVPFPFNFCAVYALIRFDLFLFCPMDRPFCFSVQIMKIMHAVFNAQRLTSYN